MRGNDQPKPAGVYTPPEFLWRPKNTAGFAELFERNPPALQEAESQHWTMPPEPEDTRGAIPSLRPMPYARPTRTPRLLQDALRSTKTLAGVR
jgi:hypothetical protein